MRNFILPAFLVAVYFAFPGVVSPQTEKGKLRVVVFGAHPDDPESGCGGLIALLTKSGHEVVVAYATCYRGTRRIGGEREGVVRRREAEAACKILSAKTHFFDYAHEKLQADADTLKAVARWLQKVRPDVVVTHWPLDTHPNHHVTASLVWQSYLQGAPWSLYFFEVMTGRQTLAFQPDLYLEIGEVAEIKKRALQCHASQGPEGIWKVHQTMGRQRGSESGLIFAEAYILARPAKGKKLLPVSFVGRKK